MKFKRNEKERPLKAWLARRTASQCAALTVTGHLVVAGLWLWVGINLGKLLWQWLA